MFARKTAEAICKLVFVEKISPNVSDSSTLEPMLKLLTEKNALPKAVVNHLRAIQVHGNFGAHDQGEEGDEIDGEYIKSCMSALEYCYRWLTERFLPPDVSLALKPKPSVTERVLTVRPPIKIVDLSSAMGLKPFQIIKDLMGLGMFASQSQAVGVEIVRKICELHGWTYESKPRI